MARTSSSGLQEIFIIQDGYRDKNEITDSLGRLIEIIRVSSLELVGTSRIERWSEGGHISKEIRQLWKMGQK